jgi:hypothetical protein
MWYFLNLIVDMWVPEQIPVHYSLSRFFLGVWFVHEKAMKRTSLTIFYIYQYLKGLARHLLKVGRYAIPNKLHLLNSVTLVCCVIFINYTVYTYEGKSVRNAKIIALGGWPASLATLWKIYRVGILFSPCSYDYTLSLSNPRAVIQIPSQRSLNTTVQNTLAQQLPPHLKHKLITSESHSPTPSPPTKQVLSII